MTESSSIGENLSAYIKHPATGYLEDGDPIDAGSMQHIANNLNHLAYESVRHIAWDWREGTAGKADSSGYGGSLDHRAPGAYNTTNLNRISWAIDPGPTSTLGAVARVYPVLLIADARPTYGNNPTFRWIRCKIRAKSAVTNSMKVACCLTAATATPMAGTFAPLPTASGFWQTVTTTEQTITITLKPEIPVDSSYPRYSLRCEESGPNNTMVWVMPGSLWFGWEATDTNDYWRSFSAYEVREG